jgi:4-diphosphocytidyl-2-C-methyl-D-erythritol kinase
VQNLLKMLLFPNAKINLGLAITEKRHDGYHNIETIFYPVNWCDALEVIEGGKHNFDLTFSGLEVKGEITDNLLYKVYREVSKIRTLPYMRVHLHKVIPMGAGLGGGSSNAAFLINLLNEKFALGLSKAEKFSIASMIGSDCAFFLDNQPVFAYQKGDVFKDVKADLSSFFILLVYPGVHSNTAEAYRGLTPKKNDEDIIDIVENIPVNEWKNRLRNDFEISIFKKYPLVAETKDALYKAGASYACMSGSGSSVFGIFEKEPDITFPSDFHFHLQKPDR